MKVLVFGASGFIGFPVAQALSRAGHVVYGQTRSDEKAKQLAANEIIPIVCTTESTTWHSLIPTLDVIIEAIGGTPNIAIIQPSILKSTITATSTLRPQDAPKLTYIYTSGTWVHGENRTDIVTDTTPITNPAQLVSWRPAFEQDVVRSEIVNGIVIRPALVYGRSGSLLSILFGKIRSEGKVSWPGTPGARFALVHQDDLAELYLLAAEKAGIVGGKIFDAANDVTESVDAVLERLVEVSGVKGSYELTKPTNLFETAMSTTSIVRPYLARALLGWQPRKTGLLDGLQVYYDAFLASI